MKIISIAIYWFVQIYKGNPWEENLKYFSIVNLRTYLTFLNIKICLIFQGFDLFGVFYELSVILNFSNFLWHYACQQTTKNVRPQLLDLGRGFLIIKHNISAFLVWLKRLKRYIKPLLSFFIISAAFSARGVKSGYSNFRTVFKIHISEWSGWANFLNNIALLGHMKNLKRYYHKACNHQTW